MSRRIIGVWILAILIVAAPPVMVLWFGSASLEKWIGVYLAGAFGGLVYELFGTRGQLELPSTRGPQHDADEKEVREFGNPLGVQVDLGFFGRMFVGALAAFTVLLLAKFLAAGARTEDFATSADAVATLAWAVAIGFTSPAAWGAIGKLAEARYKSALAVKDEQLKTQSEAAKKSKARLDEERQRQRDQRNRRPTPAPAVIAGVDAVRSRNRDRVRQLLTANGVTAREEDQVVILDADDMGQMFNLVQAEDQDAVGSDEALRAMDEASAILESILP
jgi:hypothetical protein